jgi:hypothetical protein
MNPDTPSSNDSNHEQAFDALLAEAFDAASPPDLSSTILSRLDEPAPQLDQAIRVSSRSRVGESSSRKRYLGIVAGIAAIAASITVVALVRHLRRNRCLGSRK